MSRHGPLSMKSFLISLLHEAYDSKQNDLTMADLKSIAAEYSMRLDDVVSTLVELESEGGWCYRDEQGQAAVIESDLQEGEARLSDVELGRLGGSWRPVIVECQD